MLIVTSKVQTSFCMLFMELFRVSCYSLFKIKTHILHCKLLLAFEWQNNLIPLVFTLIKPCCHKQIAMNREYLHYDY